MGSQVHGRNGQIADDQRVQHRRRGLDRAGFTALANLLLGDIVQALRKGRVGIGLKNALGTAQGSPLKAMFDVGR